jgi:pilus assembly protein CpaE
MYPLNVILIGCGDAWVGREHSLRALVRRELSNQLACVKSEFRDVDGAIRDVHFEKDEHALFLIQLHILDDLPQLQRLSAAFPGQPILALRDVGSDRQLFLGALRAGAAFAIPVPFESEDFKAALDWIAREFGFVPRQTTTIAVAGVTGAAGATTIALNLAYEIATSMNRQCILAELAVRLGMLATYLNVEPRVTLFHLVDNLEQLDVETVRQALTPVAENLHLLAGPQEAILGNTVPPADMLRVVQYLKPLADVVVLDVPCTYDDLYFESLTQADKIVLVMEQKLPSVRAVQMVRDALHRRGVAASKQSIVVNRYNASTTGFTADELAQHLHVAKVLTVANDFAAVNAAVNNGRPLRQQAANSRVLTDITALIRPLLDMRQLPVEEPNFFKRVVRAFGMTE